MLIAPCRFVFTQRQILLSHYDIERHITRLMLQILAIRYAAATLFRYTMSDI